MKIYPILAPQINWTILLQELTDFLCRNPAENLDARNQKVQTLKGYLCLLESVENRESYNKIQKYISHLFFGFLVVCRKQQSIETIKICSGMSICSTPFTGNNEENLLIVSGSLDQWQNAVELGCSKNTDQDTREIFNKIVLFIEQAGLGQIWSFMAKKGDPFILDYK